MKKRILTIIVIGLLAALSGACDRSDLFDISSDDGLSSNKEITSFTFLGGGVIGVIDEANSTITATLPFGVDLTSLAPEFVTTGASVWVGAMEQASGTTTNNFSSSVAYTVYADDSSTRDYTVTATAATGTPYEILYNAGSGSAWFGGDSGHATGRNVGHAQAVLIDQNMLVESFAFQLSGSFTPGGSDVPVRLNILDAGETILDTFDIVIPASFAGGWVTWSGIDMNVSSGTTLIFMAYVIDGTYTNEFQNSISANMGADGYTDGQRYMANGTFTDAQMDVLSNYASYPSNDLYFHLQGVSY